MSPRSFLPGCWAGKHCPRKCWTAQLGESVASVSSGGFASGSILSCGFAKHTGPGTRRRASWRGTYKNTLPSLWAGRASPANAGVSTAGRQRQRNDLEATALHSAIAMLRARQHSVPAQVGNRVGESRIHTWLGSGRMHAPVAHKYDNLLRGVAIRREPLEVGSVR